MVLFSDWQFTIASQEFHDEKGENSAEGGVTSHRRSMRLGAVLLIRVDELADVGELKRLGRPLYTPAAASGRAPGKSWASEPLRMETFGCRQVHAQAAQQPGIPILTDLMPHLARLPSS